jgi:integrase
VPTVTLTDLFIKSIKPTPTRTTYLDRTLPGFGLRVTPNGVRTFTLVHGARRQRTNVGRYPLVSLQEARTAAKRILAERTLGRHLPRSTTYEAAVTTFLGECDKKVLEGRMRPVTASGYRRLLNRHFPIGPEQLRHLTTDDILRCIRKLSGTPTEQNHAFTAASIFFRWARKKRLIEYSPLEGEELPNHLISRDRVLTDDELVAVYDAAEKTTGPFGAIVRLLILTGQRRQEISHLHADWINHEKRTIVFPPGITKNNREHVIPIGNLAAELLKMLPQEGYIFPASRDHVRGKACTVFNGWGKSKASLDLKARVHNWRLHDLRRTLDTNLAELGVDPLIKERLLNHVSAIPPMARIYDRYSYLPQMVDALNRFESKLSSLLAREKV